MTTVDAGAASTRSARTSADLRLRARFTHFPITGLCPACAAAGDAPAAASTPTSTATATTSTRTPATPTPTGPGTAHCTAAPAAYARQSTSAIAPPVIVTSRVRGTSWLQSV